LSVNDGNVFVYFAVERGVNGSVYCVDGDGNLVWEYNPSGDDAYILQGVALTDDAVLFGTDGGKLYCLTNTGNFPVAAFSSNVTCGDAPLSVQFTDASTNAPSSWSWDFDNNGVADSMVQCPVWTYNETGLYTVKLTVTNADGSDDEVKTNFISVGSPMDWTTFQGDNYNSGVTTDYAANSPVSLLWAIQNPEYTGSSGYDASHLVVDGVVYCIAWNGRVNAYNVGNGSLVWTRGDLTKAATNFQVGSPVYNDGVIYVSLILGNGKGFGVYALYANNGTTKWFDWYLSGSNVQPNTPITYDDGRLYLGYWFPNSTAGHYLCLNAETGGEVWSRVATAMGYYWAGAAVIGDYVVFGGDGGYVTSVNKVTGVQVQEISAATVLGIPDHFIESSVSYSEASRMIFFTSMAGYCCAIGYDNSTGHFDTTRKWATQIGFAPTSTPAIYGGKVYVGTGDFTTGALYCLSEANGSVLWSHAVNGGVQSSPVISTFYDDGDGEVYVYFIANSANGRVYCLDGEGNEKWFYQPEADKVQYTLPGVAVYGGMVIFGNDKGYMFCLVEA
jgi:outer membrane protein assembly factor BamB